MVPDTILVCPTTTPAWTPLFAQATRTGHRHRRSHGTWLHRRPGVRHSGGHGHRQRDAEDISGQLVTVDGDGGVVALDGERGEISQPAASATGWGGGRRLALAAALLLATIAWLASRSSRRRPINGR